MSGEDDWLVQAAAQEAGILHPAPDSFEDSDRFEGDSECSWVSSESITLAKNWRGWSQRSPDDNIRSGISTCIYPYQSSYSHTGRYSSSSNIVTLRNGSCDKAPRSVSSLADLSARVCARQMSFVELERNYRDICQKREHMTDVPVSHSLPDKLFLSVVYWCFPSNADDIRLYSCLANGNADEFNHGDSLYQMGAVHDVVQIGYLLSAVVYASHQDCVQTQRHPRSMYNVSLNVDRCRIVSCDCSCTLKSAWCQHVVALCLYRIHQANQVQYRVTIWDSVNELSIAKLKKFAQYLVNELPKEYLAIAQKLLDQLKCPESAINQSPGAPDPTDGGHEQNAIWALDVEGLHTSIRRLLIKYCVPAPTVHCDVQYLGAAQHPIAAEWLTIMKSLRAREPEGIWNLMSIVREMFARRDENAVSLLSILTVECLANCQVLLWWYATKLVQGGGWSQQTTGKNSVSSQISAQLNCAQLCDEIVVLWRCAVLNPMLSPQNRRQLSVLLRTYHRTAVDRIWKVIRGSGGQDAAVVSSSHQAGLLLKSIQLVNGCSLSVSNAHFGLQQFPGFHPCLQVCHALIDEVVPGVNQVAVLHLPEACRSDSNVPLQPLTPCTSIQKKNEKGKKRKKKNRSRSTVPLASLDFPPLPIFNDEASLNRAVRYAVKAAVRGDYDRRSHIIRNDSLREEDSSESGQESDVQLPPSMGDVQVDGDACRVQEEVDAVLAAAFLPMEPIEVRFARCEALAAHGYIPQATTLALQLADYLIEHLQDLSDIEETRANNVNVAGSSSDAALDSAESFVIRSERFVDMFEKALYLARILSTDQANHSGMFTFLLSVLQCPKFPMATKYLQVKLYYLEGEIVSLLQTVNLGSHEIYQLRDAAVQMSSTVACQIVPPIALAHFILDRFCYTCNICEVDQNGQQSSRPLTHQLSARGPQDDDIALKAALDALGSRSLFSEEDYPQLSEAIRRQKGELAIALLTRHRDSTEKLGLILDKLLDPSIHRMYSWHQSNAAYFLDRDPTYLKLGKRGERPIFPLPSSPSSSVLRSISVQSADSKCSAFDEELESISEQLQTLGTSSRRSSDEGNESIRSTPTTATEVSELPLSVKSNSKKLKRRQAPVVCTTEAHAHYMHELARRVLTEAGGNQSSVVFAPIGQNPLASNRKLHMCAFLIGMYAIGLHNQVCTSWKSRTYSTHVSWINLQAAELGLAAIEVVRETWPTHLTPSEAAGLADKAGQSRDPTVVEEAARLALSVLPYAHTLSAAETQRALLQCGEQGAPFLESACLAVEEAANKDIVFADVLFRVARYWHSLHYELDHTSVAVHQHRQNQPVGQSVPFNSSNQHQQYFNTPNNHAQQFYYENIQPSQSIAYMQGHPPQVQVSQANNSNNVSVANEMGRLHQSQSAPQLSGYRVGAQVGSETRPRLVNAHRVGIRALATMVAGSNDETRQYSKYSQTPPYAEDIRWLFTISVQLGTPYFVSFLDSAAKAVSSPFLLFQFTMEANTRLPPYPQQYSLPPINRTVPPPQASHSSKAFAHVAGRTRAVLLQTYAHPSTAELYERCIEQFYAAAAIKLSHNRFNSSDMEDAHQLLVAAITAFMRIPHAPTAHSLLEDFYRHVKKQKAWKKEVQHRLGPLLHEALNQQR